MALHNEGRLANDSRDSCILSMHPATSFLGGFAFRKISLERGEYPRVAKPFFQPYRIWSQPYQNGVWLALFVLSNKSQRFP